jgi:hypothetical protein
MPGTAATYHYCSLVHRRPRLPDSAQAGRLPQPRNAEPSRLTGSGLSVPPLRASGGRSGSRRLSSGRRQSGTEVWRRGRPLRSFQSDSRIGSPLTSASAGVLAGSWQAPRRLCSRSPLQQSPSARVATALHVAGSEAVRQRAQPANCLGSRALLHRPVSGQRDPIQRLLRRQRDQASGLLASSGRSTRRAAPIPAETRAAQSGGTAWNSIR